MSRSLIVGLASCLACGALGMWCSYISADGLDLLVFRLHTIDGRGQVEYVGMFETWPTEAIELAPNEPPPPTPD